MTNVAIDAGKWKSYIVVECNGTILNEGYATTTEEGFHSYLKDLVDPEFVVEASSVTDRVAMLLEPYGNNIKLANPLKVKIISESMKKTDKNDAHVLLDLKKMNYLPESYMPDKNTRNARDLCRNRAFLIRQRTATKSRIKDQGFRHAVDFKGFSKRSLSKLSKSTFILQQLVNHLEMINEEIHQTDQLITETIATNDYAKLIDTVPGLGHYSALGIASEIGDVNRFASEQNIWSYAGLVPRIYQSGTKEWKGRITKGNKFLKYLLVECVQIHIRWCPNSSISAAYKRVKFRAGHNKATIAAARHMLRVIYWMLKRNCDFNSYEKSRRWH